MSLKKFFCPSPWLHMRIDGTGNYNYCRWSFGAKDSISIRDMGPLEYFQTHMISVRQSMLTGQPLPGCSPCYEMEQHGKISGRQRQLTKIGVLPDQWNSMATSPWLPIFQSGICYTREMPVDWQIDLGNHCNSACVFCFPQVSSRLAKEWRRIGFTNEMPARSWCEDPVLLDRFVADLVSVPNIKYLHFIGGETLITPAFRKIISRLIDHGIADHITLGLTTNLTVWNDDIITLMQKFEQVNVGISVECFDDLNDYIRYPSKITQIKMNAERWVAECRKKKWFLQIRTTPTMLSIGRLLTVYDFAWQNKITVESCNFLQNPRFMNIDLLSHVQRQPIIEQFKIWLHNHKPPTTASNSANVRNPNTYQTALYQDLNSYCRYMENVPECPDQWPYLIDFIKRLERSRGNCILNYVPEYESIFRDQGY